MRNPQSEILDLALTQALDRYMEMEVTDVCEVIHKEWPEQIAILLTEFVLKTTCPNCGDITDFVQIERDNGGSTYVAPLCTCEWAK